MPAPGESQLDEEATSSALVVGVGEVPDMLVLSVNRVRGISVSQVKMWGRRRDCPGCLTIVSPVGGEEDVQSKSCWSEKLSDIKPEASKSRVAEVRKMP